MDDEQLDRLRADLHQIACSASGHGKHDFAHGVQVAIFQLDAFRYENKPLDVAELIQGWANPKGAENDG